MKRVFLNAFCMAAMLSVSLLAAGDFTLDGATGDGMISWRGTPVIKTYFGKGDENLFAGECERRESVAKDGSKVVNFVKRGEPAWRLEKALQADGSEMELTFGAGIHGLTQKEGNKNFQFHLPWSFVAGKKYQLKRGLRTGVRTVSGVFDDTFKPLSQVRFLAIDEGDGKGLVLDLQPRGLTAYDNDMWEDTTNRGQWTLRKEGDKLVIHSVVPLGYWGNYFGAKFRFFTGSFSDYTLRHARSSWAYLNPMESRYCLSFGSEKHGKMYKSCDDAAYSDSVGYGWVSGNLQKVTESPEGAYYSHVTGSGKAEFKFGTLQPGLYMLSIGCGNLKSGTKRFSVSVNGTERVKDFEIPAGNAVDLTIPVYIGGNTIDIGFSGNYLVSTMNLQMLLNKYEDFCIMRGFWLADDFEPMLGMLPNSDYREPPKMPVGQELYPLPEPGKEMANPRKPFVRKSAPFKLEPWHYQLKLASYGQNLSPIAALKPNEGAEKVARFHAKKGKNLLIHNGIFARTHLYRSAAENAEYEVLKRMSDEAHKHNMRIVDHQDYGLVWDCGTGFRTLVELTPILQRSIYDHGIYVYHCPTHDEYRLKFFERTLDLIKKTGIDGLMLDEFGYGANAGCCACARCRKAFFEETNWYLPVNELSPEMDNPSSPLWNAWGEFRGKRIGDYWVDLRNMINAVRPDFIFMTYSIHRYFVEGWSSGAMERLRSGIIYGTEIISANVYNVGRTTFSYRKLKNVVANCYNLPIIGLIYQGGVEGIGYFGWAMNNMNNQETWFLGSNGPKKDFNAFTENMNHGTAKPIADIAVLFARKSNTGKRNPNVNSNSWLPGKLMGLAQTLDAMHQAYIFIDESFLTPEKLAQYKVVMLPTAEVLTDQELKTLREYVMNGGRLMITSSTGKFDENRNPRAWPFRDWFGFTPDKLGWGSDMIVDGKKVVIPGKFYFYNITGKRNQGVTTLVSYANAFAPLVIKYRPSGKGMVYWFNGELTRGLYQEEWWHPGSTYAYKMDENLNRIVQKQLSDFIGDAASFKMDAPEKVYTSFYKDGDTTCIHLLNHTGWRFKPGDKMPHNVAPDAFPKLKEPVNVEVKTEQKVNEVYAVSMDFSGRKPLQFSQENGVLKFTMPGELLEVYTIVKFR